METDKRCVNCSCGDEVVEQYELEDVIAEYGIDDVRKAIATAE